MAELIPLAALVPARSPAPANGGGELPARLVDRFGRVHTNLRISVTDRCNFRCRYCMPEEMEFFPRQEILAYEEIVRLVRIAGRLGVDKVRLTGGEPLVRRDLPTLIRGLLELGVLRDLSLTTNGTRLAALADELYAAGLRRLNVSLDTLDRAKFAELTRRDFFPQVMEGLEAAARAGFAPLKVNCVALRGYAEDDLLEFARLARERPFQVRFIEFMPLDGDGFWDRSRVLTQREILDAISAVYPLEPAPDQSPTDPAARFRFTDGKGEIGIIPTVTAPFCAQCNRIRVTADGKLRHCLFAITETDLKRPLRSGASDEELAWLFVENVLGKWAGHGINEADFVKPARNMSQIGG